MVKCPFKIEKDRVLCYRVIRKLIIHNQEWVEHFYTWGYGYFIWSSK